MAELRSRVYHETFPIRSFEVSPNGFVKLSSLCNYLQEAAGNHAEQFDFDIKQLQQQSKTWVLYRFQLEMQKYPSWQDRITIETWPSGGHNVLAFREFLIYNQAHDILGRATTQWMILDLHKKRPVRIPQEILDLAVSKRSHMVEPHREKIEPIYSNGSNALREANFQVRHSDLDVNGHVNNVIYLNWLYESVNEDLSRDRQISELDIIYRAESKKGDHVLARSKPLNAQQTTFKHDIVRQNDDKTLATATTSWKAFSLQ